MHSLSPYLLRCFDVNLPGDVEDRYSILNKIGSSDAYQMIKEFTKSNSKNFIDIEKSKQVYRFSDFKYQDNKRIAYGWLESGSYGVRSDIIDVKTGKVDFKKAQNNAEIIRHFTYFYIPEGFNEGLALLHAYRGYGIKTVFYEQFGAHFNSVTKLNLQMNPLSYEKALEQWIEGQAKEIRLTKFVGYSDLADQIKNLGHEEQVLILKPPRKGSLGRLKDFLNPDSEQSKAIEFLEPFCSQVKTVIEIEGKKRVFRIGGSVESAVCEIEAPESLTLDGGNPTYEAMEIWCTEIAGEFSKTLYPDMGVSP